jgi:hypothetical protein
MLSRKFGKSVSFIMALILSLVISIGFVSPTPVYASSALTITGGNLYTLNSYPGYAYSSGKLLWSFGSSLNATNERSLSTYYTQHADNSGYYWGECVSSVKALSGSNVTTNNWSAGVNVVSNGSVSQGTAIATFIGGSFGTTNHCAFFKGYIRTGGVITGITVWDQNWYYIDLNGNGSRDSGEGVFGMHDISTSGSGVSDADNYYVLMVP